MFCQMSIETSRHHYHYHCRLYFWQFNCFLKNQNIIFQKVQQLCCYVTHGERRHSLLLSDYCSHIDPNWTQKDKEKELQQQICAKKEKDLFDESIVDAC